MNDFFPRAKIPPEDEALRLPLRAFLQEAIAKMPASERARSWLGFDAEFSRELGRRGFLGLTLPKELGGQGRSAFARFVVVEELLAAGAPVAAHWIADRQSGPLILKYGTPAQRAFYLPRICRGEAFFCIGMSEPASGSDLASVATTARNTSDGYLLKGRKIWTTHADHSHFMIALVRTSGSAGDRHQGLSQVIVDLSLPGVSVTPIEDLAGDKHFSEVLFDDVQLASDALIGSEGAGWEQVTAELAFERSGPERIYSSIVLLDEWMRTLRAEVTGVSLEDRRTLGALISQLAALREMSLSLTGRLANGESPLTESALVKDLGTTFEQSIPTRIAEALAARPGRFVDAQLARTLSWMTQMAPSFSLRGGTREILRGMIARGLGLR